MDQTQDPPCLCHRGYTVHFPAGVLRPRVEGMAGGRQCVLSCSRTTYTAFVLHMLFSGMLCTIPCRFSPAGCALWHVVNGKIARVPKNLTRLAANNGCAGARFSLDAAITVTRYSGYTQIRGHTRYAVRVGPVLLAAVGPWDAGIDSILINGIADPFNTTSWLVPMADPLASQASPLPPPLALHFTVLGNPSVTFRPYFTVQEELFEVYPAFT